MWFPARKTTILDITTGRHENICMPVLMLVLHFVPMKSSRFLFLPTYLHHNIETGWCTDTCTCTDFTFIAIFERKKRRKQKFSNAVSISAISFMGERQSQKDRQGTAKNPKSLKDGIVVVLRPHRCIQRCIKLRFLVEISFFPQIFYAEHKKGGLTKELQKTYCQKNTLHRKQQQLHFALKESEKCIIISGEEIYVKKESTFFSKPGNYKMKKCISNCMMHQGEEKRTKETSADEPLTVVLGVNALIIVTAIGRDKIRRPMQQMQLH